MRRPMVVLEDERAILQVGQDLLELEGFSVVGLSDPELIHCLEPTLHPELVLIDMMLPRISGIEVGRESKRRFLDTPLVAMSASKLMVTLGAHSGVFEEVVEQPFDLAEPLECVGHYVSGPTHPERH